MPQPKSLAGFGLGRRIENEPGDRIYFLYGVKTPFILRGHPTDFEYRHVVGYTYMHGIMNGEVLQLACFQEEGLLTG